MVHTSLEVSAPCPLLRSGKLRLFTTHCSAISANATIPPLENAQSLILDRPNIYSLVRMVDLPIDVCITPRVPPQPSPPIQDHLLTLDEVNSKIKQNTENLPLLQRQLKLIGELTKQVELRDMEYEVEAKYLQRHSCKSHLPIHINTLPVEILSLIFTSCCGDVLPVDNTITDFTFDKLPWRLSWVCAKWRLIAHRTPRLWSVIPGPLKPFASQLPQKLEWTNSPNLGVYWRQLTAVTLQQIYDEDSLRLARHIILRAEQLVGLRVSDIDISPYNHNPQDVDQKRITHHKLRFLHLHYSRLRDDDGVRSTAGVEDFFNTIDLPALTTLSLRHPVPFASTVLTDFLERSNCSLVEFEFPAVDSFKSVLEHCSNVRVIVFDGCVKDDDLEILTRADDGHWLVPHLERLTLNRPRIRNANSLTNLIQTRAQEVEDEDPDFDLLVCEDRPSTDHIIGDECSNHIDAVMEAQCGYELVNNSLVMENLELLCQDLEVLEHRYHDEVTARFWETTELRAYVITIYEYLDQVEDLENLYPASFKLKSQYKEALRRLRHNPWVFGSLPSDWI